MIKRFVLGTVLALMVLLLGGFWLAFFSARPPLMLDPAILEGDGSVIDYCALPQLSGQGKTAAEIPKGNTPGCGYNHFPLPILAGCTEPLPEDADDLRGLWIGVEGKVGHVERIEQCGSRIVVTAAGIIHDYGPNSTGALNTNDTEGGVSFTLGGKQYCPRTSSNMIWNNKVLDFHVFGWGPRVVRRYLQDAQLIWEYADGSTTRMNRICQLPEDHKTPKPRGLRLTFFGE